MLALLRTYRLPAAFLAVLMLLSSSIPLVQHACAMVAGHLRMHACCDKAHPSAAPHGMPGHHPMQSAKPCHDQPATGEPQRRAMPDCCVVESTPALPPQVTPPYAPPTRLLPALPAVFSESSSNTDTPRAPSLFFDTGPPPAASVSLHLLHAVLLT